MGNITQGVSPKAAAAVVTAVATYLVTQQALSLPPWAVVLCQLVLVAGAAYAAPPGAVAPLLSARAAVDPPFAEDLSQVPEFVAEREAAAILPAPKVTRSRTRKPRPVQ